MKQRPTPQVIACLVYVVLHFAAHVSASLFEVAPGISIWYAPAGLALSLLLLLGLRYVPVVFAANLATAVLLSGFRVWWAPILFPLLITLTYAGAAWTARRYAGPVLMPGSRRGTIVFFGVVIGAPAVLAFAGTGALLLLGYSTTESFARSVLRWWVGDVSGLLTVLPVTMVFAAPRFAPAKVRRRSRWPASPRQLGWFGLEVLVLLGCLGLVFASDPLREYNAFYLCFLPLIWICTRHGLPGATLATLIVTMGGLVGMHVTGSSTYLIINFLLFELAVALVGLGLGTAVTRRSEAERELAESESRFERVIDGAHLGLWDWNVAAGSIAFNARWAGLLGFSNRESVSDFKTWTAVVDPADRERFAQSFQDHLNGKTPLIEVAYRVRPRGQNLRWMLTRGSVAARDDAGHPLLVSGTQSDITDRKHAEAETQRLIDILEANTDFVVTANADGSIRYANASMLALLDLVGLRDFTGRKLADVFTVRSARILEIEAIPSALESGFWHGEVALKGRGDHETPVSLVLLVHHDLETEAVRYSLIMRDISRQRQAESERIENERRMLQVQKLESLGVLAGGIAHDFNNLLTTMLGNASLARIDLAKDSPVDTALSQIENAALRAAELCQQMLAYAGRSSLAVSDVDLSTLIEETTQLIQVSIRKNTTVDLQLARPIAPVRADASQLRQIVMNLVLNASEAIGDQVGRIVVRTFVRNFRVDELREGYEDAPATGGDYVVLEVEDNGCGITSEVRRHIFEPFFTTKFTGRGLGLAAVLGIVKSHRGAIRVISEPSKGSTFRIIFPAVPAPQRPQAHESRRTPEVVGSGPVLVIDDEESVRNVVSRTLQTLGYTSVTAADGQEGVEIFERQSGSIRFVLLDLTMPRMDGHEAFLAMQRIDRRVPVILMSGFSEKLSLERFGSGRPAAFISKPFARGTLMDCLARLGIGGA